MSNLREYNIDGRRAVFNKEAFRHYLTQKSRKEKIAKSKLENQIADQMGISPSAVHKWIYNGGGPMDVAMINLLAGALGISDATLLITFIDDRGITMERLNDRQKTAAKRIYDLCIEFLYEFNRTDGFNNYWFDFQRAGSKNPEMDIYSKVEDMLGPIHLALNQEYFDLRGSDIYNELCEYVSEDLWETFDGKLSFAYRFEAHPSGNPTTDEDYDRAMIRLNTIIDKYL